MNRVTNSICEICYSDRRLTATNYEALNSGIDRNILKKYGCKNFVAYSKKEIDFHLNDSMTNEDIHQMKEVGGEMTEKDRITCIKKVCHNLKLDYSKVLDDKFIRAFINYGMIKEDTIDEFIKCHLEKYNPE
jgi:hypothetical protein